MRKAAFAKELARQLKIHGDTGRALLTSLAPDEAHAPNMFDRWIKDGKRPRTPSSFKLLNKLEKRYQLPTDYFRLILLPETPTEEVIGQIPSGQRQNARWHLPKNFDTRPPSERKTIVRWLEKNVLQGATEYGAYQRTATKDRYMLRLPDIHDVPAREIYIDRIGFSAREVSSRGRKLISYSHSIGAPAQLVRELTSLVRFKRSQIAPSGMMRTTGWGQYSAFKRIKDYARMFGALAASPQSEIRGGGVQLSKLTLALLVFPAIWDWWLHWHEQRRTFFTAYERNALVDAVSLIRRDTGWIRQNASLADHLVPIKGLVTPSDIRKARKDWSGTCDKAIIYLKSRIRELNRVIQVHRDPFQPILAVLNVDAPLAEYRKIADEVLRDFPNDKRYPLLAAQRARAYLLLRLGMQLGLRRRNLSELLVCRKGDTPRSDKFLRERRRGEIRWLNREKRWEVYIPALAFKNWDSMFFKRSPYRMILEDTAGLYRWIDIYLRRYRKVLLEGHSDGGTFFVRTLPAECESSEFVGNSLSTYWRDTIIKFGIFNPYTRRGAIAGLLPHGPHSIRDVIATHFIKLTSSYELAAYALHSTPKTIEQHYCRFLAEEKTALAARVLNKVWERP